MPIYEFRCEACGAGFETLIGAGELPSACPECGAGAVARVYSPQAAVHRVVKSPGEARKQEARNAKLRDATRARFKQQRAQARSRLRPPRGGGGDG